MTTKSNAGSQRRHKRTIMRAVKINEISGVDVPAQEGAVALIMKRKSPEDPGDASQTDGPIEVISKSVMLTSPEEGHSHLVQLDDGRAELNAGDTSWQDGHTHPWVRMGGGEIVIGTAQAERIGPHIHRVAFASKGNEGSVLENITAGVVGITEEDIMSDKTSKTAEPTVAELQAQLAHSQVMASLTDAEKSHYEGLKALDGNDVAEAFLAKSAEARKAEVTEAEKADTAKAKDNDPIEYTTVDGIELRKSAGVAFIAMAKSNDEFRKKFEESENARATDRLEKRADEELPHLPGTVEERAALLKAVEGIEDDGQRKAAKAALVAQNTAMSHAFINKGHNGGTPAVTGGAETELEDLVAKHQASNSGITYEKAYDEVLKTETGAALYAKSVN